MLPFSRRTAVCCSLQHELPAIPKTQPSLIVKGDREEKGTWLSLLQRADEQQVLTKSKQGVMDSRAGRRGNNLSSPAVQLQHIVQALQESLPWHSIITPVPSGIAGLLASLVVILN